MDILNYLIDFFTNYGYFAVFLVLVACGFGVPIPEDITLIAGGVICALSADNGRHLDPKIMVGVAILGVLFGDSVMFKLGGKLGPKVTRVPYIRRLITLDTYAKIQEKVHRYGDKILFIARFLPGLRAPIFITAGISHKVSFWKFILMDGAAALISVPLWIYLGYFFANDLDTVLHWARQSEVLIISSVVFVVLTIIVWKIIKRKNSVKK